MQLSRDQGELKTAFLQEGIPVLEQDVSFRYRPLSSLWNPGNDQQVVGAIVTAQMWILTHGEV